MRLLRSVLAGLWSLFIWPITFLWMGSIVLVAWPISWFVPFKKFQAKFPAIMMGMTPSFSLSRVSVSYHPDFDPHRRSVFVQNHVSMFDGHIALKAIPGAFCGVENAAHYKIPAYGWLMREGGSIPIYPKQSGQSQRLMAEAKQRIADDYSILIFPEGHRTRDGRVGPFREGGFRMARATGAPLVPLAVRGLFEVFPKGTWIMRPGRIEIWVGPQIETQDYSEEELPQLMELVHSQLRAFVEDGRVPCGP